MAAFGISIKLKVFCLRCNFLKRVMNNLLITLNFQKMCFVYDRDVIET